MNIIKMIERKYTYRYDHLYKFSLYSKRRSIFIQIKCKNVKAICWNLLCFFYDKMAKSCFIIVLCVRGKASRYTTLYFMFNLNENGPFYNVNENFYWMIYVYTCMLLWFYLDKNHFYFDESIFTFSKNKKIFVNLITSSSIIEIIFNWQFQMLYLRLSHSWIRYTTLIYYSSLSNAADATVASLFWFYYVSLNSIPHWQPRLWKLRLKSAWLYRRKHNIFI